MIKRKDQYRKDFHFKMHIEDFEAFEKVCKLLNSYPSKEFRKFVWSMIDDYKDQIGGVKTNE